MLCIFFITGVREDGGQVTCAHLMCALDLRIHLARRHVVMFKFNDTATPEKVAEMLEAIGKLPGKVTTISCHHRSGWMPRFAHSSRSGSLAFHGSGSVGEPHS